MPPVTFHNSVRHLAGTWITRVPPTVLAVLALTRYSASWPWYWFEIATGLVVLVSVPVLLSPIWAARFRTLTVEGTRLSATYGWLAPETRATTLEKVTSVQVDEPLAQRISGVRAVTIMTSGAAKSAFEMPAMRPDDAERLQRLLEAAGAGTPHGADGPAVVSAPTSHSTSTVYAATSRDIAATAASGGYVLVLLAAAFGASQDVQDTMGGVGLTLSWASPTTWLVAALLVAVSVAVMVALRFRGFRIERGPDGRLVISYGAIERVRHTISPEQVVSVSLVRTPVDLLFGTTRLVLSTGIPTEGSRQRLVFPSMHRSAVADVVERAMGHRLPALFVGHGRRWCAGAMVVTTSVLVVAVLAPVTGPAARAGIVLATLFVVSIATRYALGVVDVAHSGDVVFRTAGLSSKVTCYRPGSLNAVVERRLAGAAVRNLSLSGWAHRRVVHHVPVRSGAQGALLRGAIRAQLAPSADTPLHELVGRP